jgi:signal transduction histidine kinase/CHASE3 domain sensor protein
MNLKAIFTSSFFLKNVFAVSLIILIFISVVSYKHTLTLTDSADLITHSYEVRIELELLRSNLTDAESGQRGYILSHDSSYLKPFIGAREKVDKSFNKLLAMTEGNLQQHNNLDSLQRLINLRFSYLIISLEKVSAIPLNETSLNTSLIEGKNVMDAIHTQINNMIMLEMVYLKEGQKRYENEISFTPIFTLLLFLFSLIVFIFSYFKINEDLNNLKKSNEQLIITTESFKHAEEIGNFSSWQWDLETSVLTYSDNQYRLLGCEPQSFKPSIKKFLEFIHPNDIHLFIQGNEEATTYEKKPSVSLFRVIRKDGQLRYFKSIGKVLTDSKGKKTLIGINSDVTEQHLSNISLEERNRDLEQSNKELASFNHVASHDLQEPLRKIQTFISRISEKEMSTMSDTGKDYFARIHVAVSRMRILIDDLLLFSSTNKSEKVYEKTDLNILLENVKQELGQAIEEKNAVIQSVFLPALNVIPFQIQQLFTNLIGNSLKYSKPERSPVIKIDSEKVIAKDYPIIKADAYKKYHKISLTDNGLGFEQQYAENIFVLFHRLHHITEYPGTGIGLAICKKIVENHAGFILAEGRPGNGSTFTFFLPE